MLATGVGLFRSHGPRHIFIRFFRLPEVDTVCLVMRPDGLQGDPVEAAQDLAEGMNAKLVLAAGGERRQDSTLSGLRALPKSTDIVLVHDSARPFPPLAETRAAIRAAGEFGGAILAAPAVAQGALAAGPAAAAKMAGPDAGCVADR